MTDETKPASEPAKPGYKTTEAWLTFFANLPAAAVAAHLITQDSPVVTIATFAISTVTNVIYIWSRTKVKTQ